MMIRRLLFPGALWTMLLTVGSAAALVAIFVHRKSASLVAYAVYTLSFYTLVVLLAATPHLYRKLKAFVYSREFSKRWITDISFRARTSLYISTLTNLIYAVFKLVAGIIYRSWWFGTIGGYYIVLCIARLSLLHHMRQSNSDVCRDVRIYRTCGILLFVLNIALSGMVIQMIHKGQNYHYPGFLIYAMAAYAFYSLTIAIVNLVRYRRLNNPVLSASKAIGLATALVAILALQTAMFVAFGGETIEVLFNILTGSAVCIAIFGMAIGMVMRANKTLRTLENNNG